jgi:hypothetical protein
MTSAQEFRVGTRVVVRHGPHARDRGVVVECTRVREFDQRWVPASGKGGLWSKGRLRMYRVKLTQTGEAVEMPEDYLRLAQNGD